VLSHPLVVEAYLGTDATGRHTPRRVSSR